MHAATFVGASLLSVDAANAESQSSDISVAGTTSPRFGPDEDVYYPSWFLGDWAATTELFAIEFPQGEALAGKVAVRTKATVGTPKSIEQYPQRYMSLKSHVIADRAFNMRGYIRGSGGGPRAFESVDWEPSSPNTTTVVIKRDGISVKTETRILRRLVAVPEGKEDLFNASEVYQQIVNSSGDVGSGGGTKVTPIRCVNKFKRVSDTQIQVLQRVEVFPRLDGAAILADAGDPEKPTVVYKYRGLLERQTGNERIIGARAL